MSKTGIKEQNHIAKYLESRLGNTEHIWTAINPQAHTSNVVSRKHAKSMGLKSGWADYIILRPFDTPVFLEVKSGKGTQSKQQRKFQRDCDALGCVYAVVTTWQDVERVLLETSIIITPSPIAPVKAKNVCRLFHEQG